MKKSGKTSLPSSNTVCISDEKFDEQMREKVVFKTPTGKWLTLPEYRQSLPKAHQGKVGDKVLYYERGTIRPLPVLPAGG